MIIYKHAHVSRGHFLTSRVFISMASNSCCVLQSIFSDSDSEENTRSDVVCGVLSGYLAGKDSITAAFNEVSGHAASGSVSPALFYRYRLKIRSHFSC